MRPGTMPRFFFNLRDDMIVDDEEGQHLPDSDAARTQAILEARFQKGETVRKGKLSLHHRIEVADEEGRTIDTVTFRDAVEIEG